MTIPDPRKRPLIMGILNITPDSFWQGSRSSGADTALMEGERMLAEGADILDVGGESTRPGADPVGAGEEADRVLPVIEALVSSLGAPVSVDTRRAVVARQALDAGAVMINDVSALRDEGMPELAAARGVHVVLMHMQGSPETMQANPRYTDPVAEVTGFLRERARAAEAAGVDRERIWLDPGIGFGKTLGHNLDLIRGLPALSALGYPVMMALSRKSMIGMITGRGVEDRLVGTALANLVALQNGARILRVHDVAAARDTIAVYRAFAG